MTLGSKIGEFCDCPRLLPISLENIKVKMADPDPSRMLGWAGISHLDPIFVRILFPLRYLAHG